MNFFARVGFVFLVLGTPLSEAHGSGAEDDDETEFSEARSRMVETQLKAPGRNISDARVLKAMDTVPRHEFVREAEKDLAYEDRPLPIGHQQTISQPFIVAFMTEKLELKQDDRVLEIGTGSGYQAAVLAELVDEVYSIEIVKPLAERAAAVLKKLNYKNVNTRIGDGYRGWPEKAPFDAIIVTCAPEQIPKPLVDQLAEGGRMIIPVGKVWSRQELYLLEKEDGKLVEKAVLAVKFVPMTRGEVRD